MESVAQFISTLLASRNQAHIFHLQTTSFAQHKALNEYYDGIIGFIDGFVESYQGKYGILRGYTSPSTFKEDDGTIKYFEALFKYIEIAKEKVPQDTYLQNQIDEILALVQSTIYKLKYLR